MESIEPCVVFFFSFSPPFFFFFSPSLARHAVSMLLDAVLDLPLFSACIHLLLVILHSAQCQEMTESYSKHSWTDPAGAGMEHGTLVEVLGSRGQEGDFFGSCGLGEISCAASLPVGGAVGVPCVSPLQPGQRLWGRFAHRGDRVTYSFTFPMEYYFPVTKEDETTRQTLERSPLLILLTTWGQNTNTQCVLIL